MFKIDSSLASKNIREYSSIGQFFIRDLKPGLRPLGQGLLSPIDGTLRETSMVSEGWLQQVKGKNYTLRSLLRNDELAAHFEKAQCFNFYLSPKDYHQIHVPISGEVIASTYIPGMLWPVNDWSLKNIDGLFAVNERLVTYIQSEFGLIALVMVGATNVGKMTVSYDNYMTNDINNRSSIVSHRKYEPPVKVEKGDKLGVFHMGSSVVMLIEKPEIFWARFGQTHKAVGAVYYGQSLYV